jgi:hypothetical protein
MEMKNGQLQGSYPVENEELVALIQALGQAGYTVARFDPDRNRYPEVINLSLARKKDASECPALHREDLNIGLGEQ